jgi:hypothetical protein
VALMLTRQDGTDDANVTSAAPGARTLDIGSGTAQAIAFADRVWLGSVTGGLTVIDPAAAQITQRFPRALSDVAHIAGSGDVAWIASSSNRLRAFSASAGRPLGPPVSAGASVYDLAVTPAALWVADGTRGLVERIEISPDGMPGARHPLAKAVGVSALAADKSLIWALSPDVGRLLAVRAATGRVVHDVRLGAGADSVVVAGVGVWVANHRTGQLTRVDERSGQVTTRRRLPSGRTAIVADGDDVYLIEFTGHRASRVAASGSLTPVATWRGDAGEAAIIRGRLVLTSRESSQATIVPLTA